VVRFGSLIVISIDGHPGIGYKRIILRAVRLRGLETVGGANSREPGYRQQETGAIHPEA